MRPSPICLLLLAFLSLSLPLCLQLDRRQCSCRNPQKWRVARSAIKPRRKQFLDDPWSSCACARRPFPLTSRQHVVLFLQCSLQHIEEKTVRETGYNHSLFRAPHICLHSKLCWVTWHFDYFCTKTNKTKK